MLGSTNLLVIYIPERRQRPGNNVLLPKWEEDNKIYQTHLIISWSKDEVIKFCYLRMPLDS